MAIGAFLTRQPLKVLIADRLGMKDDERAKAALKFTLLYVMIFVAGLGGTLATAGPGPLMPFVFVLPFAVIQIYCDVSRKSRQLIPELTGAVSISASAAAIALAGGFTWASAIGLWMIFIARLIPSILYVRQRLRLEKGKSYSRSVPAIVHAAALLLVLGLAYYGQGPYLVILAMIVLLWRAVSGLSPNRKPIRAMQIGVREVIYGAITVSTIIIGHYTAF